MKTQTSKKKKEHNIRHKKRMLLEKQIMPISLLGQVTENTLNEKENEEWMIFYVMDCICLWLAVFVNHAKFGSSSLSIVLLGTVDILGAHCLCNAVA